MASALGGVLTMGRPCRCCCSKWTHRRIAVPSGAHIATYKIFDKGESPAAVSCELQQCDSLNRWFGGRWIAGGSYSDTITTSERLVKAYGNDSALLYRRTCDEAFNAYGSQQTRAAIGPSGEFASRIDGTSGFDPGHIWDDVGATVATFTNWASLPVPRGLGFDDLGQIYLPFFGAGVGNGLVQVDGSGSLVASFYPTSIAPQDSGFASNYDYLRRPRFDAGNKWVCGSLRAYDSLTPSSPVINHLGWVGSGGGVIWRIKKEEALADGDMTPPCWVEAYSTANASTLASRIAGFNAFEQDGSPVHVIDCDVDSTGRIALLGATTTVANIAVYDADGTELLRTGFGSNLVAAEWPLQSTVYAICWGPNEDEVIVGGRATEYPAWPHP